MRSMKPIPRDPAPSRFSYRFQRLWLTPVFRALIRVGLPAFVAVSTVGWYFQAPENRQAFVDKGAEIRRSIEERPEFTIKLMAIDGTSPEISEGIREILPIDFPVSSFDLDLDVMQGQIQALDAVADATLRIRSGGILQVMIKERVPAVVWRIRGGLDLLDDTGHRVASIHQRIDRADLPLLAGAGAEHHVTEALAIFAAATPVSDRIRGIVRIGERRWDLVLDRDQRIMLPEIDAVDAVLQVMALDQAQDLLARDLSIVDMRNKDRPTLRMTSTGVEQIAEISTGNTLE